ncbi:leucine-rich repeat flightless-interacting protein 2-like [Mytilus galloprovincialis]|uniref:Leucine-rich repeat flightless-interacting protein 2 n=2 Tax=Mytilus TaxID=6548 RepID=A0A8B6DWI0_MYTGA|nr:Leucine-rich repeat flightless-interacting protein 2 [Mytilus edulis]VDI24834.1 Hypothetical predicted protein [Mytilus galloprovincialis]
MSGASGRRRSATQQFSAEDQALNQISKEAEARLAARRAARAEAREIRTKEIERQQREEEERQKAAQDDESRTRIEHRRGSEESTSTVDDLDLSQNAKDFTRELKSKLREMEEKFKKAMMTNAQLDNEKHSLVYQVELLKDQMEEQEESLTDLQRQYKDKSRELENQKRTYSELNTNFSCVKEQLELRDKLVKESGFALVTSEEGEFSIEKCATLNGTITSTTGSLLISSETADILDKIEGSLDDKIKKLSEEISNLKKDLQSSQDELHEEKSKRYKSKEVPEVNGPEMQLYEVQREASKQIHEYKLKLQKAEQDMTNLEGTVNRLDSQVKRYKTEAEDYEKLEDELKTERRKLQRELRECQNRVEELTNSNRHLQNRLDRKVAARSALVNQ